MICLNLPYYNFVGKAIKVTISTSSSSLCEKVKSIIAKSMSFKDFVELINELGGCSIESMQPLRIVSSNKNLEIIIEPASFFSKIYWNDVAKNIIKTLCEK